MNVEQGSDPDNLGMNPLLKPEHISELMQSLVQDQQSSASQFGQSEIRSIYVLAEHTYPKPLSHLEALKEPQAEWDYRNE
jgi:hypothetical protein